MIGYWILVGQTPIAVDQDEWSRWFEKNHASRKIGNDIVSARNRRYTVSTVFLGIDHGFSFEPDAIPTLFETMVFVNDDPWSDFQKRYRSYLEAKRGHDMTVIQVMSQRTP